MMMKHVLFIFGLMLSGSAALADSGMNDVQQLPTFECYVETNNSLVLKSEVPGKPSTGAYHRSISQKFTLTRDYNRELTTSLVGDVRAMRDEELVVIEKDAKLGVAEISGALYPKSDSRRNRTEDVLVVGADVRMHGFRKPVRVGLEMRLKDEYAASFTSSSEESQTTINVSNVDLICEKKPK